MSFVGKLIGFLAQRSCTIAWAFTLSVEYVVVWDPGLRRVGLWLVELFQGVLLVEGQLEVSVPLPAKVLVWCGHGFGLQVLLLGAGFCLGLVRSCLGKSFEMQ